ncbi:MAG: Hsp20/alpha crystallin family protein [Syntrophobacteraceae bacterium]|nr:Hsp20/alpha crystallin family protein [Syntrophobacteraceae bacterium]
MNLVPWKSTRELTSMRREMERLWDRFFSETHLANPFLEEWQPKADITETKDAIVVKAELPGMEPKDIDVTISGDILTIKGEKEKEEEKKIEKYHYTERYRGSFERSFRMPAEIQPDKIEASFDKGILTVTLAKTAEARVKEIKVEVK